MAVRTSEAIWEGSLREGKGTMKLASGTYEGAFTWSSRFEEAPGTNPEELVAAAHAGCFSMSLSSNLGKAGFTPRRIHTTSQVKIELVEGKNRITQIHLETEASVPGIDEARFQEVAKYAKENCPVSVALSSVPMTMNARLTS
ncbi:MAG TPA: OsmC family protein [Anaerolineaceae bacterium]|nr:OsmC family protein [Anaerolineaceae bacterium]